MSTGGYDPISVLMEEHQVFLHRLVEVRTELSGSPHPLPARRMRTGVVESFVRFLADEVDGIHGRKEEEGLFPVMIRHIGDEGGPVEVMVSEHAALRLFQGRMAASLPKLAQDAESEEAWRTLAGAAGSVDRLLSDHIDKEDHALFPMARSMLTAAEMREVGEICQEIEGRAGRTHPRPPAGRSAGPGP